MSPIFSIILPVYNSEKYLSKCIDSILLQIFPDFELILIDDGSTDGSGRMCDEYAKLDSRVRPFHKTNGGVSSARNYGINNSHGEWITFCDSDDFVDSNWLNNFYSNMDETNQLVVQGFKRVGPFSEENVYVGFDFIGELGVATDLMYHNKCLGYVWNKCFKSSIIHQNNLRFNDFLRFREDEDFVLHYLLSCNRIVCTKDAGYNYNVPDFNKKYYSIDNFYTSLSCFKSIKKIYGNVSFNIYKGYLIELTNAFYASFTFFSCDIEEKKRRLKLYKNAVGKDFYCIKEVSWLSKFVYYLPAEISVYALYFKSKLWYILKQ